MTPTQRLVAVGIKHARAWRDGFLKNNPGYQGLVLQIKHVPPHGVVRITVSFRHKGEPHFATTSIPCSEITVQDVPEATVLLKELFARVEDDLHNGLVEQRHRSEPFITCR